MTKKKEPKVSKPTQRKKAQKLTAKQKCLFDKLTPTQKEFSLNILKGMKNGPAYTESCLALGKAIPTQPSQSAADCLKSPKVKEFLDSVHSQTIEKQVAGVIMTREEALERLTRLSRAKHPGVFRRVTVMVGSEERTITVVDVPDEMTDEQLEAIEEMYNTQHGVRIKNVNRTETIKQLAQMENWNKQQDKTGEIHIHFTEVQSRL